MNGIIYLELRNERGKHMNDTKMLGDIDKVKKLLATDITSYRIAKDTGMEQTTIWNIREGNTKIERMNFGNVAKLTAYYDEINKEDL